MVLLYHRKGSQIKELLLNRCMSIRHYINIVESLQEAVFATDPDLQRPFGRKGTAYAPPEPTEERRAAELARCRKCRSADEYDREWNQWLPIANTDPPAVKQRAHNESERLRARWQHWKDLGYY